MNPSIVLGAAGGGWTLRLRQRLTGLLMAAVTLTLLLLQTLVPAQAAEEFLEPDQAFKLSARVADARTVELRIEVAKGYHLYRERLSFEAAPSSVVLGQPVLPAAIKKFDETFGKEVEIYHDTLLVGIPVQAATADFKLSVGYQGCAEKGLCYPPRTQVLRVSSTGGALSSVQILSDDEAARFDPAASASAQLLTGSATTPVAAAPQVAAVAASAASTPAAKKSEGSGIDAALRSGSLLTVVGVFLLAGLLLSFTPCVLPMVPILSSIIVGQGESVSRLRGFTLAVAYSLGMAMVYTAFGVAAGLAGEGLAAALQKPGVLLGFGALLVTLSLSMFGFYELQMPSFIQTRLTEKSSEIEGGSYIGVFLMGGMSALIVGPCVAAPLAGALVYISQTKDVLLGGLALFALACGMSTPLLLVGLSAGSLLPRAGGWMDGVKRFFGVMLIAVAIWMITPVLPTWLLMMAWATLLLVSASFMHAFDSLPLHATGGSRFIKGLGIIIAIVGGTQLLGALSGGQDPMQPLAHLIGSSHAGAAGEGAAVAKGPSFKRVKSVAELDAALATAGKPVMLDFFADWCVACKEFEKFTFHDPRVQAKLAGVLLLQADVTANTADDKALMKRFGLFGPPGIIFFDAKGQEVAGAHVIGYQPADQFLQSLGQAGI
jgi:thiol:disulfide interchange protein DsbD